MYHPTALNGEEAILGPFFTDQYSSSGSSMDGYGPYLYSEKKDRKSRNAIPLPQHYSRRRIDSFKLHQFSVCPFHLTCIHICT